MKTLINFSLSLLILSVLAIQPGIAKEYFFESAGVTLNFPDGWDVSTDENEIYASAPQDEFIVSFLILDAEDLTKGQKAAEKFLQSQFEIVNIPVTEKTDINGLNAVKGSGSLSSEDPETEEMTEEDIQFVTVKVPSRQIVFGFCIADRELMEKYQDIADKIFMSIKASD